MLGDFVYEVYEKAGDRQCCLVNLDLLQVLDWPTDSRDGLAHRLARRVRVGHPAGR